MLSFIELPHNETRKRSKEREGNVHCKDLCREVALAFSFSFSVSGGFDWCFGPKLSVGLKVQGELGAIVP